MNYNLRVLSSWKVDVHWQLPQLICPEIQSCRQRNYRSYEAQEFSLTRCNDCSSVSRAECRVCDNKRHKAALAKYGPRRRCKADRNWPRSLGLDQKGGLRKHQGIASAWRTRSRS